MLSKVQIKTIQALQHKKHRQKSGRFVAEGLKTTEELLQSEEIAVETLYAVPARLEKLALIAHAEVRLTAVTERELKSISCLTTPQEVLAVCKIPENNAVPDLQHKITLLLEAIRDPGNMGTIIRIADWFGIPQLVFSSDCVDAYNPKTIQATMGSIGRVKIWSGRLSAVLDKNPGIPLYAATLDGKSITQFQKIKEGVIAIGNESAGLSDELRQRAEECLTIPRYGRAESLNAAVATGIICGQLLL